MTSWCSISKSILLIRLTKCLCGSVNLLVWFQGFYMDYIVINPLPSVFIVSFKTKHYSSFEPILYFPWKEESWVLSQKPLTRFHNIHWLTLNTFLSWNFNFETSMEIETWTGDNPRKKRNNRQHHHLWCVTSRISR